MPAAVTPPARGSDGLPEASQGCAARNAHPLRGDPWHVIHKWASSHGFRHTDGTGQTRTFQKGIGFWVGPMMLVARSEGDQIAFQAWVRGNLIVRMFTLFMLPAEMQIKSGGFRAVLPRKVARDALNELIVQLGGAPIP